MKDVLCFKYCFWYQSKKMLFHWRANFSCLSYLSDCLSSKKMFNLLMRKMFFIYYNAPTFWSSNLTDVKQFDLDIKILDSVFFRLLNFFKGRKFRSNFIFCIEKSAVLLEYINYMKLSRHSIVNIMNSSQYMIG